MDLKKLFKLSYDVTDVRSLVIAIAVYFIVSAVYGVISAILGGIPIIGWIVGIIGAVLWVYCLTGIVLAILKYLEVTKK